MTRQPAWTFYGRQGCSCCQEAANLLLLLLDGRRVTVRMIDLASPAEAPAMVHDLPALMDGAGRLVWQGSFDSRRTELAWKQATPPRPREPRIETTAEPIVNGQQR